MIETSSFSIISKEVLTILSYFDENILNKIPNSLIKELLEYSADSKAKCFIDSKKTLEEQEISEESKDLIALIYYSYVADDNLRKKIKKIWDDNEKKEQETLRGKYVQDNLFKRKKEKTIDLKEETNQLIEYRETVFSKIIKKIKKLFNKNNI